MDKYQLAEWLHDNYEQLAKAENWQTQEITRVKFENLPAENKSTMLALADKMLGTFLIISANVPVSGSLPLSETADLLRWYKGLSPAQKCTVHPPAGSGSGYGLYNQTEEDLIEGWIRKRQ